MKFVQHVLIGVAAVLFFVTPASATFHFMVIQEVFVGPPGDGTSALMTADQRAQYVMLRMTAAAQDLVANKSIRLEDADGRLLGSFGLFTANVPIGGTIGCAYPNCPALIIGTQAADDLFTFSFDKVIDGQAGRVALPREGGRICFVSGTSVVDCVAWGAFDCTRSGGCALPNGPRTGDLNANGCDLNFGTPAAPAGLQYGLTLTRTTFNCAAKENSTDFTLTFPRPVSNSGGNDNADADADGLIDVLDCDDTSASLRWPVADLQNLTVTNTPTTMLSFSQAGSSGTGVTYDVVRGTLAKLNGFTDAFCLQDDNTTGALEDLSTPPLRDGYYYLVRANSSAACGGTTSYGPGTSPTLDIVCP